MPPSEHANRIVEGSRGTHASRVIHVTRLPALHADHKATFIDHHHGDLAVSDATLAVDAYDNDAAIYLMVEDAANGDHLGSVRLLPTKGPHPLADSYARLCSDGVPRHPGLFELTRIVTRPGLSRADAEHVRRQLMVALVEFALARGIHGFTMVTHMALLPSVIAVGWDCEPLGMPCTIDGAAVAALQIAIDAATLPRLRRQWNFVAPVLRLDLSESALAV